MAPTRSIHVHAHHAKGCDAGATSVAAMRTGRNSVGVEIDPHYLKMAEKRLFNEASGLFMSATVEKLA